MGRLCIVVAALLMSSAVSLVTARFQSRQLFVASERLDSKARELEIDWRRLQLERAEQARNARIDEIARDDLKMAPVSPSGTIYITSASAPSAVSNATGRNP
jgi:cell division protein FtsL